MTNPQDLTGRDLDEQVALAVGMEWVERWGSNPELIPRLFAEIAAQTNDGTIELIRMPRGDLYLAKCFFGSAHGSTPNEALARLLLMVAGR